MVQAAKVYHAELEDSPAEPYLASRGLLEVAGKFGLGYVASPQTGHDRADGRLAIPYFRPAGGIHQVASLRFRAIGNEDPKYLSLPGDPTRMFNTKALITASPVVAICEGEIDAMTAELCGIPAVGIPGVGSWKPHFEPPFMGYESVLVLSDGDGPGRKFAEKLAGQLPNIKHIDMGDGLDVNSFYMKYGRDALREKCGLFHA
ncbi:hypothetical protein BG452_06665 [Streptomyces sp. CBMA123]|nr:hypothetical protein [Streptomyces sp. CBMA123]